LKVSQQAIAALLDDCEFHPRGLVAGEHVVGPDALQRRQ